MKPLSDLRVLSLTHAASGPYAGRLLSEWGADLVKIEPPDGAFERTSARHHHYLSNRGKQSLSVDLKTEDGQDAIYRLVDRADVVLESYRPGVMEKLGLGADTLLERNEELVYCSISGFGESGPYRNRPAYDPIAQALSGVMHMTGNPDRKPSRVGAPLIDLGTATNAVLSIMMAIHERERTGKGQHVEVSLLETAYGWGGMWSVFYSLHGYAPERMGDKIGSYAPVGAYETKDGDVYMSALGDPMWEKLARALDLEVLITDERFTDSDSRRDNRDELDRLIESRTTTYETEEIVEHMLEQNVPIAQIKSVPEVLEDEHLQERGMILEAETEDGQSITAPDVPMKLGSAEPKRAASPPALGEHSIEVLQDAGFEPEEIVDLLEKGVIVGPDE